MKTLTSQSRVIAAQEALAMPMEQYDTIELLRSASGVPLLCSSDSIPAKSVKPDELFGLIAGSPISINERDHLGTFPERRFLIRSLLGVIAENTSLLVITTSHDQSRNGKKRMNSKGHSTGSSTDITLCLKRDDGSYAVVLDLMNSVAFMSFLRDVAMKVFPFVQQVNKFWPHNPLVIGCEFDHIHIEWPWTVRVLPSERSFLRLTDIPAFIQVGTFYNPQPLYGLPSRRASIDDGILFML